jgi:hypothetical protein
MQRTPRHEATGPKAQRLLIESKIAKAKTVIAT